MKVLSAFTVAMCMAGLAHARPVIIEETAQITVPDPSYTSFGWRVGVDGDDAIVYAAKGVPDPNGDNEDTLTTAFLFRRNGTDWSYIRPLASKLDHNEGDGANSKGLDMRNGVAAVSIQPLHVFERVGTDWVERTVTGDSGERGDYVAVNGNQIFFGDRCWGGTVFQRSTAGAWNGQAFLQADNCGSTDGASGGPVAIWNHWAVVSNPWNSDDLPGPALTFFRNDGSGNWPQMERRVAPADHAYNDLYMFNDQMFVADNSNHGSWVFERNDVDEWVESDRLRADGDYMSTRYRIGFYVAGGWIVADGGLVLRVTYDWDRQSDVVQVFQRDSSRRYQHVATLVTSDGPSVNTSSIGHVAISGRRVLAAANNKVYSFDLPASLRAPTTIQETFASTATTNWTILPGSQFAVAQSGATRVFRQSSTAGDAGAVLNPGDWTNQSIQAEVKPTAVNGADRWVGLATRRTDSANYYYVTLRSSGIIALKRRSGGQFTNLATATYPFTLNRNYRLRLESVGTLHRVYVDGVRVLEARDDELTHGHAALLSYRAAADYDNVVVTPTSQATIYEEHDGDVWSPPKPNQPPWIYAGGQWSYGYDGTNAVFQQTSVGGDARTFIGAPTSPRDTILETRARLRTFSGTAGDPWFGIMINVGGPNDYIYLSLRKSNTLTLRQLSGSQITQLGAVTQTVTPNTWYKLRLEHVGNRLRAFVNGQLRIETFTQFPASGGHVGLVTYATAADYDDFVSLRP